MQRMTANRVQLKMYEEYGPTANDAPVDPVTAVDGHRVRRPKLNENPRLKHVDGKYTRLETDLIGPNNQQSVLMPEVSKLFLIYQFF